MQVSPSTRQNGRESLPLYSQIEESLLRRITSGALSQGEALPSEQELARLYGVSRMTARQALQQLKQKGYLITVRRKGTFVTTPKIEKTLARLQGFSQEMLRSGKRPSSIVLEHAQLLPPLEIRERLQLEAGDRVYKLRRLRLADKMPIAVEVSYLPTRDVPGIESINFATKSLYSVLQHRYGLSVGWSEDTIEASKATSEEGRLLHVPRGFSILSIARRVMSLEGRPIEACCSRYRSDRYRAIIRLPG